MVSGSARGAAVATRIVAAIALLTFGFMLVFVIGNAASGAGVSEAVELPRSEEARIGAEHPGETVHVVGAVAALLIGVVAIGGLLASPKRAGGATHSAAVAASMFLTVGIVGNPDNHGGQAGLLDPAFLLMALPPAALAVLGRPWRDSHWRAPGNGRLLVLASLGGAWIWYGIQQALMQRNTWPPLSDPHHQAHWYAMGLVGFLIPLTVGGALLRQRGWRAAATSGGLAAAAVALGSLVDPDAASALHPVAAILALLWAALVIVSSHRRVAKGSILDAPGESPRQGSMATFSDT